MIDRARRGFTLVELMVTMLVLAVVASAVIGSVATSAKTQRGREMLTRVQGESRDALRWMDEDLRGASLGTTSGVIWADSSPPAMAVDPNPVAKRPAVQIFDNVPGGADFLQVKPGTDAILVVSAMRGTDDAFPETLVAQRTYYDATQPLNVSEVGELVNGARFVLVGAKDATWAGVASVAGGGGPGQLTLAVANGAVFPNGKMDAGSRVRIAAAHLYYVNAQERLVRVSLTAPRPPLAVGETFDLIQLAEGIENLQIDCETDGGLGVLGPCPDVIPPAPMSRHIEEAKPAGLASATGPRLTEANVGSLRMVHLMMVARSLQPVLDGRGDDPIAIGNQTALLPVTNPKDRYLRRLYRMTVGVRNTSLGAF